MRAVVQRVSSAEVHVDGERIASIGAGLLLYLGAERGDGQADVDYVAGKVAGLRIFPDDHGRMSRSPLDLGLPALVVSQFTLFGDLRKGLRPSFHQAAPPDEAERLYEDFQRALRDRGLEVAAGRFRADMKVGCVVDGPVTILVDSRRTF